MKHDLQDKEETAKSKRFKVLKACHTCRVKKIKVMSQPIAVKQYLKSFSNLIV